MNLIHSSISKTCGICIAKAKVCYYLLASQSIPTDDRSGVDPTFYQFICILQEFCSNDHLI